MIGVGAAIWILNSMSESPFAGGYLPFLGGYYLESWGWYLVFGGFLGGGSHRPGMVRVSRSMPRFRSGWQRSSWRVWAIALFIGRRKKSGYISQDFLLTAFVAFAWAYGSANGFLQIANVTGPSQPAIQWWYFGCLISLWLTPLAIGIVYHFVPLLVGATALHSAN